jgi:hypothetical protein
MMPKYLVRMPPTRTDNEYEHALYLIWIKVKKHAIVLTEEQRKFFIEHGAFLSRSSQCVYRLLSIVDVLGGDINKIRMEQLDARDQVFLCYIRNSKGKHKLDLSPELVRECAKRNIIYNITDDGHNLRIRYPLVWKLLDKIDECGGHLSKISPWIQFDQNTCRIIARIENIKSKSHIILNAEMVEECAKRGLKYEKDYAQIVEYRRLGLVWRLLSDIDRYGGHMSKITSQKKQLGVNNLATLYRICNLKAKNHIKLSPEMIMECAKRGVVYERDKLKRKTG